MSDLVIIILLANGFTGAFNFKFTVGHNTQFLSLSGVCLYFSEMFWAHNLLHSFSSKRQKMTWQMILIFSRNILDFFTLAHHVCQMFKPTPCLPQGCLLFSIEYLLQ